MQKFTNVNTAVKYYDSLELKRDLTDWITSVKNTMVSNPTIVNA